jgi:hypothetical protein
VVENSGAVSAHTKKERLPERDHAALGQDIPADGQQSKDGDGEQNSLPVHPKHKGENNETNDGKESWRGKVEHLPPGTDSKNVFSPDLDAPIDSFSSLLHNRPSPRSINWLSQITETKRMSNIEQGMSNDEV